MNDSDCDKRNLLLIPVPNGGVNNLTQQLAVSSNLTQVTNFKLYIMKVAFSYWLQGIHYAVVVNPTTKELQTIEVE